MLVVVKVSPEEICAQKISAGVQFTTLNHTTHLNYDKGNIKIEIITSNKLNEFKNQVI